MKSTRYISTRSSAPSVGIERAVIDGLAPDGGLYVPDEMPRLPARVFDPAPLSYADLAWLVLAPFFPGWDESWFRIALSASCSLFDTPDPVPLVRLDNKFDGKFDNRTAPHILELFHGPTCAFKDLALSLMGSILRHSLDREGIADRVAILVATSGDTGSAALAGFARRPGISTVVYYPATGTSLIQRLQMTTTTDPSQKVLGIRGNFDDAQRGVKQIFSHTSRIFDETGVRLSSANSINMARLLPQIVYYVKAWRDLLIAGDIQPGHTVDFTVPTGNFGDILAARYAKAMGLPIGTLVCASNTNRVLADFFATGTYDRRRDFAVTTSPSMDILVSSNLERAIFESTNRDPIRTAALMKSLADSGHYTLTPAERSWFDDFAADWVDESSTAAEIARVHASTGYLLDPHTAVASLAARRYRERENERQRSSATLPRHPDQPDSTAPQQHPDLPGQPCSVPSAPNQASPVPTPTPMVICATASPFKFPAVCLRALDSIPDAAPDSVPEGVPDGVPSGNKDFAHAAPLASETDPTDLTDLNLARILSDRTGIPLPPPIAALVDPPAPPAEAEATFPSAVPISSNAAIPYAAISPVGSSHDTPELHTDIIDPADMESALMAFLKGN